MRLQDGDDEAVDVRVEGVYFVFVVGNRSNHIQEHIFVAVVYLCEEIAWQLSIFVRFQSRKQQVSVECDQLYQFVLLLPSVRQVPNINDVVGFGAECVAFLQVVPLLVNG